MSSDAMTPVQLSGERVTIRTTTPVDRADLIRLWNDGRVMRWVGFPEGLGYDENKWNEWFERLQRRPHLHHFCVSAVDVGFCGELHYAVDVVHHRAGLDIKFVPHAQGRGLATDALKTLIRHVFETEPDIELVWTEPREGNTASRALYARCGLTPQARPPDMEPFESFWALSRDTK